ncbi:NUDIX hydrolase [bacterium]|nr:NUDIX hydrolase [bacterium]
MDTHIKHNIPSTHRVAVGAYIFDSDGKILLLHRINPPNIYAPPGGRLNPDENPFDGILREVDEETGIEIDLLGPSYIWFGKFTENNPLFLGIDFIARASTTDIVLSDEHDNYIWAKKEQILSGEIETVDENGYGYSIENIVKAFELYNNIIHIQ